MYNLNKKKTNKRTLLYVISKEAGGAGVVEKHIGSWRQRKLWISKRTMEKKKN